MNSSPTFTLAAMKGTWTWIFGIPALTAVALGYLTGCGPATPPKGDTPGQPGGAPPVIAVVNYPLKYFAERIAGDDVEVSLVKDGRHQLDRPSDIALMLARLDALIAWVDGASVS